MSGIEQHPFDDAMLDRGKRLGSLIGSTQEWVTRRIERVEFEDGRTFRRVTTFDVGFDREQFGEVPCWRGRLLLPLKALQREHDVDATVLDASGVALPQLTFRHERALVAAAIAWQLLPAATRGLRAEVARGSYEVILLDAWDPEEFEEACRRVGDLFDAADGEHGALRAALARYANVGTEWGKRWVIASPGDLTADQEGCLFRLQVVQSERLPQDSGGNGPDEHHLDDLALVFDVEELGECESFHFELSVPTGVLVKNADLSVWTAALEELKTWDPAEGELPPIKRVERRNDDPHHDRAHVFFDGGMLEGDVHVLDATVEVVLRPMTIGGTRAGVLVGLLATATLVVLALTIGWVGAPRWLDGASLVEVRYGWQPGSVVSMLLLGPTLLAALVVQEREHLMTKRVLEGHRRRLMGHGLLTFGAAGTYALGMPDRPRWWLLVGGSLCSLLLTVAELRSYRLSRQALRARGDGVSPASPSTC